MIKVESPSGDPARFPKEKDGRDKYVFRAQNRNKKSVILNLKESTGRLIARDLISHADVVLESFRPGVAQRLGIGYKDIVQEKPDIIYCSLSGYGQKGCMSYLGSHDLNYRALSGVLSQLKDKDGNPAQPSMTFADLIGGIVASESISAALFQRERTGKGAYLDLSITDVMVTLMTNHLLIESATGGQHGISKLNKEVICYHIYETKDGRFISLGALEPKFWENFCLAVNKKEWIPAQLTAPDEKNSVFQEMKNLFLNRTFKEWTEFAQKVDCCMAPVLETGEMANHAYYKERKLVEERWGLRYVSTRAEDESVLKHSSPPPKLGEHTRELYRLPKNIQKKVPITNHGMNDNIR